jgi:hypothetical protein
MDRMGTIGRPRRPNVATSERRKVGVSECRNARMPECPNVRMPERPRVRARRGSRPVDRGRPVRSGVGLIGEGFPRQVADQRSAYHECESLASSGGADMARCPWQRGCLHGGSGANCRKCGPEVCVPCRPPAILSPGPPTFVSAPEAVRRGTIHPPAVRGPSDRRPLLRPGQSALAVDLPPGCGPEVRVP